MLQQLWHDLWVTLFVVLVVIGIVSAEGLVVGFGVMGLMVAAISWLWNKLSLEEVTYERHLPQRRVFIGEEVSITVSLTNKKPVPLARLVVEDEVPKVIHIAEAETVLSPNPEAVALRHSISMAWYERVSWTYQIRCFQRGLYQIGPVRLVSGDLFGFFSSERTDYERDYLLVYPRIVPLPDLGPPAAKPLGELSTGMRLFPDPSRPSGVRDYQLGDPLKIMDWKASARMQKLQVRTFDPSSSTTLILVVVVETAARYWEGYSARNLERVITASASVASYAVERQYSLGLFSDGTPMLTDRPMKIPPSRSPEQLTIILGALATIRPLPTGTMGAQLVEESRRFPLGATLIVVAALVLPDLVEAVTTLKSHGYRFVMVYVGDGECPALPDGVVVRHMQDYFARMETESEFLPG